MFGASHRITGNDQIFGIRSIREPDLEILQGPPDEWSSTKPDTLLGKTYPWI